MSADLLWTPPPDVRSTTRLGAFADRCGQASGRGFADYDDLWRWSVTDGLETMWAAVWDHFDVLADARPETIVTSREPARASWFVGSRLNYAEHALRRATDPGAATSTALVGVSQSRPRTELSWSDLADAVGRARAGLRRLGVGEGDRVAAYLPNIPETIVAFLAAAGLGAVFTSCAPEFGVQAVLDRFRQVEPKVLLTIDGYRYGERLIDRRAEVDAIRAGLPSLQATVHVSYLADRAPPDAALTWEQLLDGDADHRVVRVAADHPLYVLYSSGTTGLPKAIVHGHGGILLEHLKTIGLHGDMGPDDTFTWYTTTGWMMWNYLVSGLLVGARLVLVDGDPSHPHPDALWELAEQEAVTWFGAGAPYLSACRRRGSEPGQRYDLSALRAVGSTGAPLPAESFRWVYEQVSDSVLLSSISGGTDVCSAFVGGSPWSPVWAGEISTRYLGAAVEAFDESHRSVVGEQGELVITQPMPSMPVGLWGDDDGSRLRATYFDDIPGVWRHGDWITITERGSCVISGRSDATLNRGGVRIGTAEMYRVVESIEGVVDSLVVHLEATDVDDPGALVLFVVTDGDRMLDDDMAAEIRSAFRAALSPRHVPDEVHQLTSVPTTLSGKKLEVPVKKILLGADPEVVASRGALRDPGALDAIVALASHRAG